MEIDFCASSVEVARALIGASLFLEGVGGRIVETEAYDETDPASHSHAGRTARNAAMFGPPGRAYVYRSYGLHWCLNVVCMPAGHGAAVLIRALEPTHGIDAMRRRRRLHDERLLCAGPGRLCEALAITREREGLPVDRDPFRLVPALPSAPVQEVIAGTRIGISKAREQPWRFALSGSRNLSRPMPVATVLQPAERR